jgi:tetratricopeptide (TPR) repeat protein
MSKQVLVHEALKWLLIATIFALFSLLWASTARGAPPLGRIGDPPIKDQLWTVVDLHRQGRTKEAIALWQEIRLPEQSDSWRYVALTAAHLRERQIDEAVIMLETLECLEPDNALAHYYKGLLSLTQAEKAPIQYDAIDQGRFRLVSLQERSLQTAEMYRRVAMQEFEKAIELGPAVKLDMKLLPEQLLASRPDGVYRAVLLVATDDQPPPATFYPVYPMPYPMEAPTVGELLTAIGADNFVGKAHNMLGPLYLDEGLLTKAESHMDSAVDLGMHVQNGYSELARRYDDVGQHGDAFRANLKAMAHGNGLAKPGFDALDSLLKGLFDR